MPPAVSRRTYLASAGAAVGGASLELIEVVGAGGTDLGRACEDESELRATLEEKQATLESMRAEMDSLGADIETLEAEIPSAREAKVERDAVYADSIRGTAKDVGLAARESVIYLEVSFEHSTASGTAWFVGDGQVLTNSHNVSETDQIQDIYGWTVDGERIDLTLVDRDEDLTPDVALLATDHDAPALPTGDSTAVEPGQPLVVVGHPGGYGNWVISLGEFESRTEGFEYDEIHTDIPNLQGNSGSPTMTLEGEVVAMLKGAGGLSGTDGPPPVADDSVQTELIATREDVLHDPIEAALDRMGDWT